ncbi:MAG: hypothetical protein ACK4IT_10355 [Thioalkalivibrionaceae bacterium]
MPERLAGAFARLACTPSATSVLGERGRRRFCAENAAGLTVDTALEPACDDVLIDAMQRWLSRFGVSPSTSRRVAVRRLRIGLDILAGVTASPVDAHLRAAGDRLVGTQVSTGDDSVVITIIDGAHDLPLAVPGVVAGWVADQLARR